MGQSKGSQISSETDCKLGQTRSYRVAENVTNWIEAEIIQSGANWLETGIGITKWDRDYKLVHCSI